MPTLEESRPPEDRRVGELERLLFLTPILVTIGSVESISQDVIEELERTFGIRSFRSQIYGKEHVQFRFSAGSKWSFDDIKRELRLRCKYLCIRYEE